MVYVGTHVLSTLVPLFLLPLGYSSRQTNTPAALGTSVKVTQQQQAHVEPHYTMQIYIWVSSGHKCTKKINDGVDACNAFLVTCQG